uniref:Ig-like domain-containing protein n=1 Tax=Lates calcarifer TaxID=8187 RepID=A0A4W6FQ13_LATCA
SEPSTNMKVCPTLIFYSGIKGEDVTVKCSLSSSGHLKIFCKDKCEADDVLIQTTGNRAETGRYSIRYEGGFVSGGDLSVTITQLTSSDSGQYRCGLGEFLSTASYEDVEIMVADGEFDENVSVSSSHRDFTISVTDGEFLLK